MAYIKVLPNLVPVVSLTESPPLSPLVHFAAGALTSLFSMNCQVHFHSRAFVLAVSFASKISFFFKFSFEFQLVNSVINSPVFPNAVPLFHPGSYLKFYF